MPPTLVLLGLLTVLIGAWGGIVPFVGPTFGYSADGATSWTWNLAHVLLALVPGALVVLAGLVIWARGSALSIGRGRISLGTAGLVTLVCGAWFVIGPFAWSLTEGSHNYFVVASPLRYLANVIGYSLGTGVVIVACGAFALGWAVRQQRPVEAVDPVAVPGTRMAPAGPAGGVPQAPAQGMPQAQAQGVPPAQMATTQGAAQPMSQEAVPVVRRRWWQRSTTTGAGPVA